MIRIQPEGGVQVVGAAARTVAVVVPVVVGSAVVVGVSVAGKSMVVGVGVGKLSGNVGGICVGVEAGGRVSASDRRCPRSPGLRKKSQRSSTPAAQGLHD